MSIVSVTVQLEVETDDPLSIEQAIAAEARRAARELYREVVDVLDTETVESWGGVRQRREPRWVATLFGRVRILRYRTRGGGFDERRTEDLPWSRIRGSSRSEPRSRTPLDARLGLSRGEPSPALRELVRELSSTLSEQSTADVVNRVTGEPFSRQGVRRILEMDREEGVGLVGPRGGLPLDDARRMGRRRPPSSGP